MFVLPYFSDIFVRCLNNKTPRGTLYTGMDVKKQYIHRCLALLLAMVAWGGVLCQGAFAQERKVQNRPYIDMRRWHYGFLFGTHMQDLEFVNNGYVHTLDDGT